MQQAECTRNCWITGAIAGLGVMLLVSGIGDTDWLGGLFLGLLTCVLLGGLLVLLVAQGQPAPYDHGLRPTRPVAPVATRPVEPVATVQAEAIPEAVAAAIPEAPAKTKPAAKQGAPRAKKPKKQDLKQINGIGPKIEEALNDLGITRFAQIAAWTSADEQEISARLGRLGGRISSDDWVAQARNLAGPDDVTGGGNG